MKKLLSIFTLAAVCVGLCGADADAQTVTFKRKGNTKATYNLNDIKGLVWTPIDPATIIKPDDVPNLDKFYYPGDPSYTKSYEDMFSTETNYNFKYSAQSEHFFVFWDKRFGEDPSRCSQSWARVDIDDLLAKAERFFHTNIEVLGMAKLGEGKSNLDKYKMQIWLIYDDGWVATGSGYGDVIGALWVTPSTCKPVGSTIAHEIGHSFQYQVYADLLASGEAKNNNGGFRYGWGGTGGCAYWEQCAQWQSMRDYPGEQFGQDFNPWLVNYHRHFCHEWMRYQSYWLQSYWVMKRGIDAFGAIWRESRAPEDPIQTYMRLYLNNDTQAFWDEYYDYASRMVTYDLDNVRQYRNDVWGASNQYSTAVFEIANKEYQISYANCPETAGFNIIRLNVPEDGGNVSIELTALKPASPLAPNDPGEYKSGDNEAIGGSISIYNGNRTNNSAADFRFGLVAVVDGKPQYGDMVHGATGTADINVPAGAQELYLVVVPTPAKYTTHAWDNDDLTDEQWPYKFKVSGSDLFGHIEIDTAAEPTNLDLVYDVNCSASNANHPLGAIDFSQTGDLTKLAQAFVMQPSEIAAKTSVIAANTTGKPKEGNIVFGLMQTDGSIQYKYTANVGFYVKPDGSVGAWGQGAPIYAEYDKDNFVLTYGHKPGDSVTGTTYTMKPCLVYTKDGVQYVATFTINMHF